VVVQNRGGAGGNIGTEQAVLPPTGTRCYRPRSRQVVVNPHTYPSLPVNTLTDFVPIAMARTGDFALVAPCCMDRRTGRCGIG
jgi:tripartite-type tricarboxylate transporter receptor subunit TctC